jgi:lysozyme
MAKKKKGFSRAVIFSVIILTATAVGFYYIRLYSSESFIHYAEFGIDIPANYAIHGIDVSKYQKKISWKDVEEMNVSGVRIGFAFIKATEGTDKVDEQYNRNWRNINKTSLRAGAYHYFIASKSGKAQAVNFIKTVELKPGNMPPVLDIEEAFGIKPVDIQQRVADWLFMAERAYKVKPIIYTNLDFYRRYLSGRFDDYPLWIAHYNESHKPRIERSWTFWQHNEAGHVSGINAYVDFNVFNGDSTALLQLMVK